MDKLKELICNEIRKFESKNTLSMSDLEIVNVLVNTYKNILKVGVMTGDKEDDHSPNNELIKTLEETMSHADSKEQAIILKAIQDIKGR